MRVIVGFKNLLLECLRWSKIQIDLAHQILKSSLKFDSGPKILHQH
jgi:hypothetical protein